MDFLGISTYIYRFFRCIERFFSKEDSSTSDVKERWKISRSEFSVKVELTLSLQEETGDFTKKLDDERRSYIEHDKFAMGKLITNSVVYVEKEYEEKPDDAKFHFCANCFDNGKKSAITISKHNSPHDIYKCPACGTEVFISHNRDEDIV